MKFAIIDGKIYTVNKEEKVIEKGTILINNGKIEAVLEGKETPEGYEIIDAKEAQRRPCRRLRPNRPPRAYHKADI